MNDVCTNNNRMWPETLIELLNEQCSIADQLSVLAQRQATFIHEDRTDHLLGLLADRQALIDRFTASQGALTELTQGLEQRLQTVNGMQRERIRTLIATIGQRLGEIMQRDAQDEATLRETRDTVRRELTTLSSGKQARNAYKLSPATGSPAGAMFADRKG